MRLQEWVADAVGFFNGRGAGLRVYPYPAHGSGAPSVSTSETLPSEWRRGAFETFVQGRPCDISSACHWAVNMAGSAGHGQMWGHAYSVTASGIYVAYDSPIRTPDDLRNVEVGVGYHSGSHFSAAAGPLALRRPQTAKVRFIGSPQDRVDLLV